jgi:hypothetical protein
VKANTATSAVDDDHADARIGAAPTAPAEDINGLPRRRAYDDELGGYVTIIDERDPFSDEILPTTDIDTGERFTRAGDDLVRELQAMADAEIPSPREIPAEPPADPADDLDGTDETEETEDLGEPDPTEPEEPAVAPAPARGRRPSRGRVPAGV